MRGQVCSPRIEFATLAVMLLSSTLALAHDPQSSDLADNPAVAAQLQSGKGKPAQLDGELEIIHQDFPDGHGHFVFNLKEANGNRVPMQFAKHPPTHLLTGDHVTASGQMLNGSLLLYSGSTSLTKTTGGSKPSPNPTPTPNPTPSIPVPNTFGSQSTLVILVNFMDDAVEPFTVTDTQNMFFYSANNFFTENSYGQTSIVGAVVGWYTIPDSVTSCNTSQIASDAQNAAAAAGTNLSNYTRFVYVFPLNNACAWAGSSFVGGNPSQSWINGNTLDLHIIDHELGHAFGLWHSHLLDCGTTATIGSGCNVIDYGDLLDTMGVPQTASAHYNAFQKERLGWLNYGSSPAILTVQTSGTYTMSPYEAGGAGPNALKIIKSTDPSTGAKTWYYLEARQAIGFDAFLSNSIYYTQNETAGVLFHLGSDNDGNSSNLLDMTPATPTYYSWFDPSLVVGQSFQDTAAGVTFTPQSVTATGATINIQLSGTSPAPAAPSFVVSTNQANYNPGDTVAITASASYGGSPVANVSVTFAVTKANGNQVTGSATTGGNGVAVYKLRLKQTDPVGTYIAGAAATIKGNSNSASTKFTLQ